MEGQMRSTGVLGVAHGHRRRRPTHLDAVTSVTAVAALAPGDDARLTLDHRGLPLPDRCRPHYCERTKPGNTRVHQRNFHSIECGRLSGPGRRVFGVAHGPALDRPARLDTAAVARAVAALAPATNLADTVEGVTTEVDRLGADKYVLLTTFRKDGRAVPTPVWAARDGAELLVWTETNSGKVKRIRRQGTVELAPCDMRGRPKGQSVRGRARVLDADATRHARALISKKYGLIGWLFIFVSKLRRGEAGTIGLAITVDGADS